MDFQIIKITENNDTLDINGFNEKAKKKPLPYLERNRMTEKKKNIQRNKTSKPF